VCTGLIFRGGAFLPKGGGPLYQFPDSLTHGRIMQHRSARKLRRAKWGILKQDSKYQLPVRSIS
jgi:hypothetical protein